MYDETKSSFDASFEKNWILSQREYVHARYIKVAVCTLRVKSSGSILKSGRISEDIHTSSTFAPNSPPIHSVEHSYTNIVPSR